MPRSHHAIWRLWPEIADRLLPVAHEAGIPVIAWIYTNLDNVTDDMRMTQENWANYRTPTGDHADGLLMDVEEVTDTASVYTYGQVDARAARPRRAVRRLGVPSVRAARVSICGYRGQLERHCANELLAQPPEQQLQRMTTVKICQHVNRDDSRGDGRLWQHATACRGDRADLRYVLRQRGQVHMSPRPPRSQLTCKRRRILAALASHCSSGKPRPRASGRPLATLPGSVSHLSAARRRALLDV